ncbi:MAG TPA: heavy metal-binding domain-containing protein, partial [Cystobacter sp.]
TPSSALYVCPMHRDVTAHEPGRCPKCGMKLVLQAPPTPKESTSREEPVPGASSMQGGSP